MTSIRSTHGSGPCSGVSHSGKQKTGPLTCNTVCLVAGVCKPGQQHGDEPEAAAAAGGGGLRAAGDVQKPARGRVVTHCRRLPARPPSAQGDLTPHNPFPPLDYVHGDHTLPQLCPMPM